MVPQKLEDWTLDKIRELLAHRYMEQETFDYKEKLPDRRDETGKRRLRKDCCAFANSSGGFLVFGVHDDTTLSVDDRLVGFDPHFDFPIHFGNFPSECNPSVRWEIKNPAITLAGGNVLHVVWFSRSWNAPHSIGKAEEGFVFPKRTNKGTEHMSYEEVRMMFLGYYEKRVKLQLLQAELTNMLADANALMMPPERAHEVSTASFRLHILESVLVDTFTILAGQTDLLKSLHAVRNTANHVNNKLALFYSTVGFPASTENNARHNEWLRLNVPPLVDSAMDALRHLSGFLAAC